jgi:ATP-dependent helicase/nuclease subunit B
MTSGADYPLLHKSELFGLLAGGHASGITVVTPNRRLAQELAREFDQTQIAAGLRVWETADILPLTAFVERLYEDAFYSELAPRIPLLLSSAQEHELWEAAIRASRWGDSLLAVPQAAADARKAWVLAHDWRIAGALGVFPGNDDALAFVEWTKDYVRRSEGAGHTDTARLTDIVADLLNEPALRKPRLIVTYAFDLVVPQKRDFFLACEKQGMEIRRCLPQVRQGTVSRLSFADARQELETIAAWARQKLESGAKRIGVVIPELGQRRKEVARVFTRVMLPAGKLPGAEHVVLPFNLSLGAPLSDYPLVRSALAILELSIEEISYDQASKLIRSPFVGGAQSEMAARARLDARLRRHAPSKLTLGKLVSLIEGAPNLGQQLEALLALTRQSPGGERSPQEWARNFSERLKVAEFPGERGLDSEEFQTQTKFNEVLAEFAKLERVVPRMSAVRALGRLRRHCNDTLFQPETIDAPIQILGVLESAGIGFDALWVSGLTDEVWPLAAQPNPFIPPALQRKAAIPEASPEASLERGRRITEAWLSSANEVLVSCPMREQDRELLPSSLIAHISTGDIGTVRYRKYRDYIFDARGIETLVDAQAPVLANKSPRGGTRILADQAACPFRAFARHRLAAEGLEEPAVGPDARVRGQLLHTLMKEIWSALKDSQGMQQDCGPAIERAAAIAVSEANIDEPFAALERNRLAKIVREWLEVERGRPDFEVVAMEEKRKLVVAGLELGGRIDRMDKLASGGHVLIDYKSGRPTPNEWQGERPDDPQLPLYALNAKEDITAVTFAKLKTGEMRYMGFSKEKNAIPEVKQAKDWDALIDGWKKQTEALGSGFASGDARVDPKNHLATCRYCDLQPLCRVYERANALADVEGDADD